MTGLGTYFVGGLLFESVFSFFQAGLGLVEVITCLVIDERVLGAASTVSCLGFAFDLRERNSLLSGSHF